MQELSDGFTTVSYDEVIDLIVKNEQTIGQLHQSQIEPNKPKINISRFNSDVNCMHILIYEAQKRQGREF